MIATPSRRLWLPGDPLPPRGKPLIRRFRGYWANLKATAGGTLLASKGSGNLRGCCCGGGCPCGPTQFGGGCNDGAPKSFAISINNLFPFPSCCLVSGIDTYIGTTYNIAFTPLDSFCICGFAHNISFPSGCGLSWGSTGSICTPIGIDRLTLGEGGTSPCVTISSPTSGALQGWFLTSKGAPANEWELWYTGTWIIVGAGYHLVYFHGTLPFTAPIDCNTTFSITNDVVCGASYPFTGPGFFGGPFTGALTDSTVTATLTPCCTGEEGM